MLVCDCAWTEDGTNCGDNDGSYCWNACCNPEFEPGMKIKVQINDYFAIINILRAQLFTNAYSNKIFFILI